MLEARGLREVFREVTLYAPASAARQALASFTRALPEVKMVGPYNVLDVAMFITGQFGLPSEMTELARLGLSDLGWMGYFVPGETGVSSAGFLTVGGSAALLHTAATRPENQGQGGQSALILRRLQEGLAQGCEHFLVDVEAGQDNPSRRNLERLGFRPVFEVPFYTAAEPAD
ncbi:GNAT family N-acetyltransferase [Deinococcus malanensis]